MAYKGSLFQLLNTDGSVRGELVFDAIVSEEHEVENKVTEFPVDSGFVISDHVIRKNRTLKMEVVSVRHAFKDRQLTGGKILTGGNSNKPKADFELLNEIVQKGIRVNIVTILGAYTNCIITKYRTKQDVNTSTVMQATLVAKEMNVVSIDSSSSRQALFDAANSVDIPNPQEALKNLLGKDHNAFIKANKGKEF